MRSLQFELWTECNSLCKYCYLGDKNRFTSEDQKLKRMQYALDTISDESIFTGENPYEVISYLGGEFFQGQLSSDAIKSKFFELMNKTNELLDRGVIKQVWIYVTMTIGDQNDLYETLKIFEKNIDKFWLLTSWDTAGRFHTQKMEDTWKYHMKNIRKIYPKILFNTTTIVTGDLINHYLNDEFTFDEFTFEYETSIFLKPPSDGVWDKITMNQRVPNFFPKRTKMLEFLSKFRQIEPEPLYDKLFNIKYRADTLYSSNDENNALNAVHRFKDRKIETDNPSEMQTMKCGHVIYYQVYIDSDKCCLCDKIMIGESF